MGFLQECLHLKTSQCVHEGLGTRDIVADVVIVLKCLKEL